MSVKSNIGVVTDGLVFYVDAGNDNSYPGSGTTWSDLVGGNDGTLTNGPTYDSTNGGSIVFDGTNDKIIAPNLGVITNNNTDQFTIGVWLKTTSTTNYNRIVKLQSNVSMFLSYDGGFSVQSNGDNAGTSPPNTFIRDGNWHYAVVTYNEGVEYTGYKDGSLSFTVATSDLEDNNGGNTAIGDDSPFNGSLATVTVYNRVLPASEVLQNYNALKNRFI
jgi:hypothetical protein